MPILEKETSVYPDDLFEASTEVSKSTDRCWWGIFTKSRQEKALARDLLAKEIPFYLPLVHKENRIRGRVVQSHIPLFSGYVFLFGDVDERYESLTTNRISRILPVTDHVQLWRDLRQVRQAIETGAPLTLEARLQPGRPVRIKRGPMQGLEGIITNRRGRRRLLVEVHFLQSGVSVEIEDYMVEPV